MKLSVGLFLFFSALLSQTFVSYMPPTPLAGILTGSVNTVPFVMPCGATSYTAPLPGNDQFLACNFGSPQAGTWSTNSTYAMQLNGAADWVKFTGNGSAGIAIRKKVASHRISNLTILPTGQATFATLQLGYYPFDPYQTEDFDLGSPALPLKGNATPQTIYTIGRYTNCFSSGALVSNCGQSITLPVSNKILQSYYVAVGTVGKVNGTFRVHFSDSSVADYVYTDTDALTGTATDSGTQNEKMFTLKMQSVASGVTATVSYTGASLGSGATSAGLAIIAAGMGGQTTGAINPNNLPEVILSGDKIGHPEFPIGVYGSQVTVPDSSSIATAANTISVAHVNAATDAAALQAAYNTAITNTGGTKIILADGFNSGATVVLPNSSGRDNGWIVTTCAVLPIRPSGTAVPYGQQVNPLFDTIHCHIMGNSAGDQALRNDNNNASITARQAHHFAFIGIEFGFPPSAIGTPMYNLIEISGLSDNPETNPNLSPTNYPHHFLFERCWIHGAIPPGGSPVMYQTISGLVSNANYFAVYDSYFNYFSRHESTGNNEAKALWWNGSGGPITLKNNHFEANTEGVICCAQAQPTLGHSTTVNVLVDHNYFTKDRAEIGFALEKNHLEFKAVTGASITNNVFENSWSESQAGQAIALNSHIGVPTFDPLLGISNVLVSNNYACCAAGISVNLSEELGINVPIPSTQLNIAGSVKIQNNWFQICASTAGGGSQPPNNHYGFIFGGSETGYDVTLDHNSVDFCDADTGNGSISAPVSIATGQETRYPVSGARLARRGTFIFSNNVMPRPTGGNNTSHYGIMFPGVNFTNNEIETPGDSAPLAKNGTPYDTGASWYGALKTPLAGPYTPSKAITGLGSKLRCRMPPERLRCGWHNMHPPANRQLSQPCAWGRQTYDSRAVLRGEVGQPIGPDFFARMHSANILMPTRAVVAEGGSGVGVIVGPLEVIVAKALTAVDMLVSAKLFYSPSMCYPDLMKFLAAFALLFTASVSQPARVQSTTVAASQVPTGVIIIPSAHRGQANRSVSNGYCVQPAALRGGFFVLRATGLRLGKLVVTKTIR